MIKQINRESQSSKNSLPQMETLFRAHYFSAAVSLTEARLSLVHCRTLARAMHAITTSLVTIFAPLQSHLWCLIVWVCWALGTAFWWDLQWFSDSKESFCNVGDPGSIPGSGWSPEGGNGNPLQYSCLENPMDRGAWWATVHGVTKSLTRLSS